MKPNTGDTGFLTYPVAHAGPVPDRPFVAVVDGTDTPLLPLNLPPKLKGQAREDVAARQLFDAIGVTAEQSELRPFAQKPHTSLWTHALVVDKEQVNAWRRRFKTTDTKCLAVLPDYMTLPAAKDIWTLDVRETRVLARLGLTDGFTAETEIALLMLAQAETPKAVLRLGSSMPDLDKWLEEKGVPVYEDARAFQDVKLPIPRAFANNETLFDLSLSPRAAFDKIHTQLKAWRMPVALALLAIAFWSASVFVGQQEIKSQTRETRLNTNALVRQTFVPTGPILDIRSQVSQALNTRQARIVSAGQNIQPLDLLKAATAVIAQSPATLDFVTYDAQSGLQTTLRLPDFAALDQLAAALEGAGIAVSIMQSSSAETGGVEAVLALVSKGEQGG